MADHHFGQSRSTFFLGMLVSPVTPKAVWRICVDRIQLLAVVVRQLLSATKVIIMSTVIWPVIIEIVFGSHILGFLGENVENYCAARYQLKSYVVFVRAAVLRSHKKKIVPFSVSWGERVFSPCPWSVWSWTDELGWGLLSQFSPFRYFPHFPLLSKQTLAIEYRVHIWQVSPQLSCGDTCQI